MTSSWPSSLKSAVVGAIVVCFHILYSGCIFFSLTGDFWFWMASRVSFLPLQNIHLIKCQFVSGDCSRNSWHVQTFWQVIPSECKVLNTSMIVYHSLNVTVSSLTLKLKLLVVVKSSVISLCHYLNFVLCISRLCIYNLKLQFGMITVFKWESKPALKIQLILFFS